MKLELTQKLQQQQILAPQMILSMDLLLLTNQELEARIEKEFMENPALELETGSEAEGKDSADEAPAAAPAPATEPEHEHENREEVFARVEDFRGSPSGDFFERPRRRAGGGDDFDRQEALQNIEGRPPGLREYLLQQLHLIELPPRINEIGEFLINDLDERGYLIHPAAALRAGLGAEATDEEFAGALAALRSLDPPGVGAENLQECLILQLERDRQSYPLEVEILRNHIDDLSQNKIPKIARDLGKTIDDIKEALEIISLLQPFPGSAFVPAQKTYVRPDVVIEKNDDEIQVMVQDHNLPSLQISESCRKLLQESRGNKEMSDFLRKKIDSAHWLIQAIQQRRRTIRDISEAIVKYQCEFMEKGPEKLRAMKMQTIADIVGVHISTISRAIKGKYIQTPCGIYEMRYFFTGGVEREDGELESRRITYKKISEIIDGEDKRRPLSDTAIARILRGKGLDIARRTVTKYRDQEGIPPSRLRRVY